MVYGSSESPMFDEVEMKRAMSETAPPGTVHTLLLSGTDSACGCPCVANGTTLFVNNPPNLCADLDGVLSLEEYVSFVSKLNVILKQSHVPLCPCGVIPFGMICGVVYTRVKRNSDLNALISQANAHFESNQRKVRW